MNLKIRAIIFLKIISLIPVFQFCMETDYLVGLKDTMHKITLRMNPLQESLQNRDIEEMLNFLNKLKTNETDLQFTPFLRSLHNKELAEITAKQLFLESISLYQTNKSNMISSNGIEQTRILSEFYSLARTYEKKGDKEFALFIIDTALSLPWKSQLNEMFTFLAKLQYALQEIYSKNNH